MILRRTSAGASTAAPNDNIFSHVDIVAAREKVIRVIEKLRALRLTRAADLVEAAVEETLAYYDAGDVRSLAAARLSARSSGLLVRMRRQCSSGKASIARRGTRPRRAYAV